MRKIQKSSMNIQTKKTEKNYNYKTKFEKDFLDSTITDAEKEEELSNFILTEIACIMQELALIEFFNLDLNVKAVKKFIMYKWIKLIQEKIFDMDIKLLRLLNGGIDIKNQLIVIVLKLFSKIL